METWKLACIVFAALGLLIILVAYKFFNDEPEADDQLWYNNYQEANRPYVELYFHCKHEGEKSLVNVSSAVNCETVNTVCDDCGQTLKTETECR